MMLPSRFHAFRARMANHPASVFPRPCVREEWACAKSDVIFLMKGLKSMKRVYVACSRLLHRHALPIDYILGWTPFCGQRVRVQRPLLIPRRDTEQWLHIAIEKYFCGVETVLEVGTGTGCIAMALANQIPNLKLITAVDVDRRAINVASKNCLKYPNVEVIQADIFQNSPILSDRKYDLVISNPPYIRRQLCSRMVAPSVSKWESHQALFAERDVFYKRIINLQTAPILALEIDGSRSTCRRIIRYASEYYSRHRVIRDGANLPRALIFWK